MKLFLVIYAAGHIGGWIGPLPQDVCSDAVADLRAKQVQVLASGIAVSGAPMLPDQMARLKTMTFACELRQEPPKMGEGGA